MSRTSVTQAVQAKVCVDIGYLVLSSLLTNDKLSKQNMFSTATTRSVNQLLHALEQGTLIEWENEMTQLRRLNEKRTAFKSWVIAPIPGKSTAFIKSWLVLVRPTGRPDEEYFPTQDEKFTVDFARTITRQNGNQTLCNLRATRTTNPYEEAENLPNALVGKCAAFQIDVPHASEEKDGIIIQLELMEEFQIARALDDFQSLTLDESKYQPIIITWEISSQTYDAELGSLRHFTEEKQVGSRVAGSKSRMAFEMICDFENSWKTYYDLHASFPHLRNPTHPHHRLPKLLVEKLKSFNPDHLAALDGLSAIPNGLYFVNGCPGAGKTEWNMVLAALIQSKRCANPGRQMGKNHTRKKYSPILYLVDINKTVDDAADRYYRLCKAAGLKLRIIRMHGFPYEMRNSDKLNAATSRGSANIEGEPDFTKKFLTALNIARHSGVKRDPNRAPTLDEAAWDYFEKHQVNGFPTLKRVLARMQTDENLSTED